MKLDWKKLIISIIVCQAAGVVGSIFTMPALTTWYATLAKPSFTPPGWVIGIVWTVLFLLMGLSLYLVWVKKPKKRELPFFDIQLALNILWSAIFFGLRNPSLAFVEIIFLWLAILGNIIVFYKIDKKAAWLLVPYLAWVSFAAVLNYSVWMLNAPAL